MWFLSHKAHGPLCSQKKHYLAINKLQQSYECTIRFIKSSIISLWKRVSSFVWTWRLHFPLSLTGGHIWKNSKNLISFDQAWQNFIIWIHRRWNSEVHNHSGTINDSNNDNRQQILTLKAHLSFPLLQFNNCDTYRGKFPSIIITYDCVGDSHSVHITNYGFSSVFICIICKDDSCILHKSSWNT